MKERRLLDAHYISSYFLCTLLICLAVHIVDLFSYFLLYSSSGLYTNIFSY